jgi:DNA or RNA helicases of superfamily II
VNVTPASGDAGLAPGVYEHVVTAGLDRRLRPIEARVRRVRLDPADAHEVLARHLAALVRQALRAVGHGDDAEKVARQVELANRIAAAIADLAPPNATDPDALVAASHDLLHAIAPPPRPPELPSFPPRPSVPMSTSALFVNGPGQPNLGTELRHEIGSADGVDLICAFIRFEGLRVVEEALRDLVRRGGEVRVLTTTYRGVTQRKALDRLVDLGAQVRVSYETRTTRLHAKAWLFRRNTELHSAYVGSSNLSRTALLDGLEWNVRLSAIEQPHLIEAFALTFEQYWHDGDFEPYDPARDGDRLDQALAREQRGPFDRPVEIAPLEVEPKWFQAEILDELEAERSLRNRWRNLVVMATGTGKTVVAALDYRRLRQRQAVDSLLFVAHREEILRQSLSTFRQVMREGTFGELLVGGQTPTEWRHVFASIQSLTNIELDPTRFDMVIVDEFHHAAAATYTRLLNSLRPKVLLGLTATPERADGQDVTRWFGGHIASELRLWEALERNVLVPFHYFGIHDDVSLEHLRFRRGQGYDTDQLSNLYTGNDARVRLILAALAEKVADVGAMRAVGFCVSIAHAQFMAAKFTAAGIPSLAVTAQSSPQERRDARHALEAGTVKVLFTVDLYNEGVDIPTIDTVLFLRPTESATVFLQQLGRGLRRADGKTCLTVLDFIGAQHADFRFDLRFRALTGVSRRRLEDEIEQGFPTLPAGCSIQLDRVAQRLVLENVRRSLRITWSGYAAELRRLGPGTTLEQFLEEVKIELADLYRPDHGGWAGLRRAAGLDDRPPGLDDKALGRRISRLLHIDDPERLQHLRDMLAAGGTLAPTDDPRQARLRDMLRISLFGRPSPDSPEPPDLVPHPSRREELAELTDALYQRIRRVTHPLDPRAPVPLHVHARYRREEVLAAFGVTQHMWEGVYYVKAAKADLFFVTLNKTEAHFSPTTMYADRAITPELFQWESQSTLTAKAPTTQRYVHHEELGSTVHLFLRESATADGQLGRPAFFYAGTMSYVEHHGERPVRFTWRLHRPLPADIFHIASPAG